MSAAFKKIKDAVLGISYDLSVAFLNAKEMRECRLEKMETG